MDNKNIALSDVERNKELFEYEMTEVILQLRGEFAKFSGKDLHLEHAQLSAPDIDLQADIPSVELEAIAVETQEITGINCEIPSIPCIAIGEINVNCPTVPAVNIEALKSVKIDESQLNCQAVNINIPAGLKDVSVEKTSINLVNTDITVPQVCEDSKVSISNISLDEIEGASAGISVNIPDVEVSSETVDIPETDIKIKSDIILISPNVEVDVPVINALSKYEQTSVSVEDFTAVYLQSIPERFQCDIPKIDMVMEVIDIADTDILIRTEAGSIASVKKIKVDIPAIERLNISEIDNLEIDEIKIEVPQISDMSVTVSNELTLNKIHLDDLDTKTPVLNINLASPSKVNVRMPNLNIEYPAVSAVMIPNVIMEKPSILKVPELQDFSGIIKEIIEAAV